MKAVWIRARSELRAGVRSWIALGILVGLGGGFVLAAAVGGRRTDTSYDRLVSTSRGWDVLVTNYPDPGIATFDPAKVERLPQVAGAARFLYDFSSIGPGYPILAPADEGSSSLVPLRVLRGRLPDPRRVDEVAMSFALADQSGFRVGSTFPLFKPQLLRSAAEQGFSVPQNFRLKVVGIVSGPGEFPPVTTGALYLHMTPAYYEELAPFAYQPQGDLVPARRDAVAVRLRQGLKDLPAFRKALLGISERPGALEIITQDDLSGDVDRSIHYQALALWLLAALAGLAVVLIFSQTLARQIYLQTEEYPYLRAMGMSRGQLWLVAMGRAVALGTVGAVIAVVVAILLSPLTPIGLARIAELRPGFWVDGWALAVGAGAALAAVLILATLPAWRAARLASQAPGGSTPRGGGRPSFVAGNLSRSGAPATAVIGVRMALESGRGRTAVPVRTTLLGVTIAVAVMGAAFGFGASLDRLLVHPTLYGWNWDLDVTDYGQGEVPNLLPLLDKDPRIVAYATGPGAGAPAIVNGRRVGIGAFDPIRGEVLPPIVDGHAPGRAGEIALGGRTMHELGTSIGSMVRVHVDFGVDEGRASAPTLALRVVGRVVVPPTFSITRFGDGALVNGATMSKLTSNQIRISEALIRLRPGVDKNVVFGDFARRLNAIALTVVPRPNPADYVNFGRVPTLPVALATVLAVMAAGTLGHTVASGVVRRRRDLAVLKTLGFVRSQVSGAVAWHATTIALVALVFGLPAGVAGARWTWNLFADQIGVVSDPSVGLSSILLTIPATILVANLIAAAPARLAARTQPALVLRSE